jgi:hypothetical protein
MLCLLLQFVKLKAFSKFDNTTEALAAATALVESKLSKGAQQLNRQYCCIQQATTYATAAAAAAAAVCLAGSTRQALSRLRQQQQCMAPTSSTAQATGANAREGQEALVPFLSSPQHCLQPWHA